MVEFSVANAVAGGSNPLSRSMDITNHALDRFQEKHPEADHQMMRAYYFEGTEIDAEIAGTLTVSNRRRESVGGTYILAPDYSGLFVQVDQSVVTFLRFGAEQRQLCEELWGNLVMEEKAPIVFTLPPDRPGTNPYSVKSFRFWAKEALGITELISFPRTLTTEQKQDLCRVMRTTPGTHLDAYTWVWPGVRMELTQGRYLVRTTS